MGALVEQEPTGALGLFMQYVYDQRLFEVTDLSTRTKGWTCRHIALRLIAGNGHDLLFLHMESSGFKIKSACLPSGVNAHFYSQ